MDKTLEMTHSQNPGLYQSSANPRRQINALTKTAATAAVLIAVAGMVDALTSNMGAGAVENSTVTVTTWFNLFQTDTFSAFSCLGIINILTLSLGIPINVAFFLVYRRDHPFLAGLAAILFFTGAVAYFSTNTVLPMYALSRQYAAASGAQKALLETAGQALLAQGADLTPGTFMAFCFTQTSGLLITALMLTGRVFGKWTGGLGLTGFALTTVFFVLAAFFPHSFDTAMLFAMPGGIILTVYQILLARGFYRMGQLRKDHHQ